MSALPNNVREIDLLRWVKDHPNQPFDPVMVVTSTHTSDWQWQAVLAQMEELRRQTYINKLNQDAAGSTYWTITPKGENYLRALERFETGDEEAFPSDWTRSGPVSHGQATTVQQAAATKSKPAPPTLTKTFGAASVGLNSPEKLTFTISNPNPNVTLTGIGFLDIFPAGLEIAKPKNLVGSWADGKLTAIEGTDRIALSNATLLPGGSCSFQMNITATIPGIKNNVTTAVTSQQGGQGNTASATLSVPPATEAQASDNEVRSSEWFDRATVERFSEQSRTFLNRADELRSAVGRPAVSVFDLVTAFFEKDGYYISDVVESPVLINVTELSGLEFYSSIEGPPQELAFKASWKFPPITQAVRLVLAKAKNKADELSSALIEDSHIFYGLLSLSETNHPLILELHKRGITPDVVKLPTVAQGPSTHVARDRWTTQDSLGYFPYAYAIYRFLTDKNTAPPLAISIQAPWGGGKTSMMRMIQAQLDPDSIKRAEISPGLAGKARIKDIQQELNGLSRTQAGQGPDEETSRFEVPPLDSEGERRVTIWFNAWKYESTAQVWAGLADTIVHQIGDRLGPIERELFWLQLRLRRIDAAKIRNRIHEQVLSRFWEKLPHTLWAYVLGPALSLSLAIVSRVFQHKGSESFGWAGTALTTALASILALVRWKKTQSEVENQPARLSLGELVEAPDYGANLGFIHHVVEDLRKVFQIIPKKYLPMLVFIDDLDRCSPNKVSEVIEAVNLFLAGEFPNCMFVLGIDDEMVAAALNKAHSDVISKLPSYAKSASIGWRFMDKFVQLPFIVPPPTPDELKKYAESLFSEDSEEAAEIDIETRNKATQVIANAAVNTKAPQQVVHEVAKETPLSPQQQQTLQDEVVVIQQMDRNIRAFTDEEKKIRDMLIESATAFSTNPRDIKRFVNVFRFYYFLRAAREARKDPVPSLAQLSRWILFSLKWPEAVRYLSRIQLAPNAMSHPQFVALERAGKESQNLDDWKKSAALGLGMNAEDNPWLSSQEMMGFFKAESGFAEAERLSASCGKGLW